MTENTQGAKSRRNLPQSDKQSLVKSTANIILKGKKLNTFPLRSGTRRILPFAFY